MVYRYTSNPLKENLQYELFALAVHIGSIEMGHYVAYSKRGNDDRWHLFNDE